MRNSEIIAAYANQPITHQMLLSLLKEYKRPNDKISDLLKEGELLPVKRGLYIIGAAANQLRPESFLIANHIFGPSYVSLDSALSIHGLIPERVYEISSMTTKSARKFRTPVGNFAYYKLPLPYYAFGITRIQLNENQYAMVASPEKALFDKVVATKGVLFRSSKQVMEYLIENLRMDESSLLNLDIESMKSWIDDSPKKEALLILVNTIENL